MNNKLSEEISKKENAKFFTSDTITLNFKNIVIIDSIPVHFHNIQHLHLSHNKIKSLTGISVLTNLKSLSISYNCIDDWEELLQISNPSNM